MDLLDEYIFDLQKINSNEIVNSRTGMLKSYDDIQKINNSMQILKIHY